jgi:nucleoside-diphosphate-sugar epimerase
MRVLITGAGGFIGQACVARFVLTGRQVRAISRRLIPPCEGLDSVCLADPLAADWRSLLEGVDCILHLAGIAHQPGAVATEYEDINIRLTELLADAGIAVGVKRFVLLSSVAIHGRQGGHLNESSPICPVDSNGRSKAIAESRLQKIAHATSMEWTIVRPPMVYGAGAPGNFRILAKWVRRGIPLPLLAARSPRSYIGIDNLIEALLCVTAHPKAANRIYLVSDNNDLGTADLISLMARALGRRPRLWWLPGWSLRLGAVLLGRAADAERIFGSLQLDTAAIRNELGWIPHVPVEIGIALAMDGCIDNQTQLQN